MTETHEAIEELLAGYVLRSLSGEDAARADHLLSDHVPQCPACRDSLAVFQAVTADLCAGGASPSRPPDTLLPRLHRDLGVQDRRRRRPVAVFAVAASVVAVVGFAGLAVTQNMRVNDTRSRMDDIRSAMDFATRPGASMVQVDSSDSDTEPITEISQPGRERFYLVGNDVPMPPEGTVYRVWLLSGTQATCATDFVPEPGMMVVELEFDPSQYDRVLDLGRACGIDARHAGDRGLADGQLIRTTVASLDLDRAPHREEQPDHDDRRRREHRHQPPPERRQSVRHGGARSKRAQAHHDQGEGEADAERQDQARSRSPPGAR